MPFRDSRLKIKRANSAKGILTIYYSLNRLNELPDIALIVGDAIHNLKTALDYSWFETIRILAPSAVSKFAKFPVYPSIQELEAALKSKQIDILSIRLYDLMLSDIKPYQGGDFFIWAIHKMDITDKNRLLIPTANYGNVTGMKVKDQQGKIFTTGSWGGELAGQFHISVKLDTEIEDNGYVTLEIIFKEGPAQSLEVSETLRISSVVISQTVELLEKLVEGLECPVRRCVS